MITLNECHSRIDEDDTSRFKIVALQVNKSQCRIMKVVCRCSSAVCYLNLRRDGDLRACARVACFRRGAAYASFYTESCLTVCGGCVKSIDALPIAVLAA
jgi:hypothetical protein